MEYGWILLAFIEEHEKLRFSDRWTAQHLYSAIPCFARGAHLPRSMCYFALLPTEADQKCSIRPMYVLSF
jgi:hypothetical protein